MITQVSETIYRNEIALPGNPLKVLSSYIIRSEGETLVVDTGFNLPECKAAFLDGLKSLNIPLKDVNLFATHLHSDHCGLLGEFCGRVKSIRMGAVDGGRVERFSQGVAGWANYGKTIRWFGLTGENIDENDNPGYSLMSRNPFTLEKLNEGDTLKVGAHIFEVIDTPGHTPGHVCLYDRKNRILFTGDHVLETITPNIAFWGFEIEDILGTYLKSLLKIRGYEADLILTGHRQPPLSLPERVDALMAHHEHRLHEILNVLSGGEKTVLQVASSMEWAIRPKSWNEFPKAQKWFAAHEAMSHLEHLVRTDRVKRVENSHTLYYSLI